VLIVAQDKKFIITTDRFTAEKLINAQFTLVNKSATSWTFINEIPKTLIFDEIDKNKYCYSNILSL
jgi:hypothetical protein